MGEEKTVEDRSRIVASAELQAGPDAPLKHLFVPIPEILIGLFLPSLIILVSALVRIFFLQTRPWIQGYATFFMLVLFDLTLLFYALAVCKKRGLRPLFRRASPQERLSMLFSSLLLAIGINFGVGAIHLLLRKVLNQELEMPDYAALATSGPNSLLSLLLILTGFTVVPVLEEIYFRGFLYNALKSRLPRFFSTVVQSMLFAAAHGAGPAISILYFLAGMALTAVYEAKKDLTFPVLVHGFINSIALIPLLVMVLQNFHMPAATWEEARRAPPWLASPPDEIERKTDGAAQRQYAIETWGSEGFRQWKKEAAAFNAVCAWFPEERAACAQAKVGIVSIYVHSLKDYRRAIIEADDLISKFPDREEEAQIAFSKRGVAYLMIQELEKSRESFERARHLRVSDGKLYEEAEKGIGLLYEIEARK